MKRHNIHRSPKAASLSRHLYIYKILFPITTLVTRQMSLHTCRLSSTQLPYQSD